MWSILLSPIQLGVNKNNRSVWVPKEIQNWRCRKQNENSKIWVVVFVFSLLYLPRANLREDRCILVHSLREFMMGRHDTSRSMVIGTCDYTSSSSHISVERKESWENCIILISPFYSFIPSEPPAHVTVPHTFKGSLTFQVTLSEMPSQRNKDMWPNVLWWL